MKLNDLLKYLNEVAPAEAPKDAPLGQYLFAPNRKGVPPEKNTPLETEIFNSLASHYFGAGNAQKIDKDLATLLDLKNKGMYQKLLRPPEGLVYRFIANVSPKEASALFLNNLPVEEIVSVPNKAFYASPIGVIENPAKISTVKRGKTNLSSWTIRPNVPVFTDFAYSNDGKVSILLVAKTQGNNFFINPKEMSKLSSEPTGDDAGKLSILQSSLIEDEQEVIGHGPINVLEASFIYFGDGLDYKVEMALMNNVPKLATEYSKQELIPGIAFQPLITYVDAVIAKYTDNFSKKQHAELQKLKRPILKLAQSKSKVPGEVYLDAHENAQTVIEELCSYLQNTGDYIDSAQEELLKAINLKMKRHW